MTLYKIMRTCKTCSKTKPLTAKFFYKHNCGFRYECVECVKVRVKTWAKANPEKRRIYSKVWREANTKECKEYREVYQKANRERLNAYATKYRKANFDKISAYHAARYKTNPERASILGKIYRETYPERVRAVNKAWIEANPKKRKSYSHNRRTRKMIAEGYFTDQDIDRIWKKQRGRCSCCRVVMDYYAKRGYSIEHKIPLSRGGTNWPSNLELMCMPCNSSKNAKTPNEFRKWLKMIAKAKDYKGTERRSKW